ncbi:MAG: cupin domain-containing protein [Sandaracinaceae bacterium]
MWPGLDWQSAPKGIWLCTHRGSEETMRAHWMDTEQPIEAETLVREGVTYEALSTDANAYQPSLDALKARGGYVEQDEVALRPEMPNLAVVCAKFDREHRHEEDEVRFVLEGEGVFDIRSRDDRWMRVTVSAGDLIVVPKDRHHRFMLTETRSIRCVRLFQDQSGWVPHYRA